MISASEANKVAKNRIYQESLEEVENICSTIKEIAEKGFYVYQINHVLCDEVVKILVDYGYTIKDEIDEEGCHTTLILW